MVFRDQARTSQRAALIEHILQPLTIRRTKRFSAQGLQSEFSIFRQRIVEDA
jgi:hypothetical protein